MLFVFASFTYNAPVCCGAARSAGYQLNEADIPLARDCASLVPLARKNA
jgi:hypothetical protein